MGRARIVDVRALASAAAPVLAVRSRRTTQDVAKHDLVPGDQATGDLATGDLATGDLATGDLATVVGHEIVVDAKAVNVARERCDHARGSSACFAR